MHMDMDPFFLFDQRMVVCMSNTASQKEDIVSSDNGTFTKTVHVLDDKERPNKCEKIKKL